MTFRLALAFASLSLALIPPPVSACTAVAFAPGVTADGAAYTASSADCKDCDFRLARVELPDSPARPASRDVYAYHSQYPHVVSPRSPTWSAENLEGSRGQVESWVQRRKSRVLGTVPEERGGGKERYVVLESGAGYGLSNSAGLGISESTCSAHFVAAPVGRGGEALLDVAELSRIAMERCGGAREAVELMGALAEEFGFYGAEWTGDARYLEAGEALMVSDAVESWVFHILPDDSGKSAIWAARRVPPGEVSVVANQFLIRKVKVGDASGDYLASGNMKTIAVRHGLHHDGKDGPYVDFSKAFGKEREHESYASHRVYRVLTLVNPSLVGKLDPYPNPLMDGYPFSVKPAKEMTVHDIFRIFRDHYEGTEWDMTASAASEPFGNPERFDMAPVGNLTLDEVSAAGEFGRAISIGRTSYVAVVRSTNKLPKEIGPMMYFSQQQPDASVFLPLYVAAARLPRQFTRGSLFRYDDESMFWAVTAVSNWIHKYYLPSIKDLRVVQDTIERQFSVDDTDARAAKLIRTGKRGEAVMLLEDFSKNAAATSHDLYGKFFKLLMARFHDGFRLEDAEAEHIQMTPMFYSLTWLATAQYFSSAETGGGVAPAAPVGVTRSKPGHAVVIEQQRSEVSNVQDQTGIATENVTGRPGDKYTVWLAIFASGIAVGVAGSIGVALLMKLGKGHNRVGYQEIG